jgi:hypothetical protein
MRLDSFVASVTRFHLSPPVEAVPVLKKGIGTPRTQKMDDVVAKTDITIEVDRIIPISSLRLP